MNPRITSGQTQQSSPVTQPKAKESIREKALGSISSLKESAKESVINGVSSMLEKGKNVSTVKLVNTIGVVWSKSSQSTNGSNLKDHIVAQQFTKSANGKSSEQAKAGHTDQTSNQSQPTASKPLPPLPRVPVPPKPLPPTPQKKPTQLAGLSETESFIHKNELDRAFDLIDKAEFKSTLNEQTHTKNAKDQEALKDLAKLSNSSSDNKASAESTNQKSSIFEMANRNFKLNDKTDLKQDSLPAATTSSINGTRSLSEKQLYAEKRLVLEFVDTEKAFLIASTTTVTKLKELQSKMGGEGKNKELDGYIKTFQKTHEAIDKLATKLNNSKELDRDSLSEIYMSDGIDEYQESLLEAFLIAPSANKLYTKLTVIKGNEETESDDKNFGFAISNYYQRPPREVMLFTELSKVKGNNTSTKVENACITSKRFTHNLNSRQRELELQTAKNNINQFIAKESSTIRKITSYFNTDAENSKITENMKATLKILKGLSTGDDETTRKESIDLFKSLKENKRFKKTIVNNSTDKILMDNFNALNKALEAK